MTKINIKKRLFESGMALTACGIMSPVALGQEGADVEASTALDEIIVTAQKRSTSLQSTAAAVSAFSGNTLEKTGTGTMEDLQRITPGLVVSSNYFNGEIYLRGVGSSSLSVGADPSVSTMLDGVYIARPTATLLSFLDVERVEVVKGPQGTLYGRNSTGGAINVISKKPTDEFEAGLSIGYGNYETISLKGHINVPIVSDLLNARVAFLRTSHVGWVENLSDVPGAASNFDDDNFVGGRMLVSYTPNEDFDILFAGDFSRTRGTGPALVQRDELNTIPGADIPEGYFTVNIPTPQEVQINSWGVSATANYNFNTVSLKSIISYRGSDNNLDSLDSDGTDLVRVTFNPRESSNQFSAEIQLSSNESGDFEWLSGLYYFNEDAEKDTDLPLPFLGPNVVRSSRSENTAKAYAAFAQGTYHLSDRLAVTAGIRYSVEEKSQIAFLVGSAVADESREWKSWTPSFTVEYEASDDVFFYANAKKGTKSGAYDSFNPYNPPVDQENLWSYEFGAKTEWLDNHVRANLSSFYYSYSDLQVITFVDSLISRLQNAAEATIKGVELEVFAQASKNLFLTGSIAYLDATYDDFPNYDGMGLNLAGNQMVSSPKWKLNFGADYSHEFGDGLLTWHADVAWRDKIFYSVINQPEEGESSLTLLNARISWKNNEETWGLALYGRNLTNEVYFRNVINLAVGTGPGGYVGEPRSYGVELSAKF